MYQAFLVPCWFAYIGSVVETIGAFWLLIHLWSYYFISVFSVCPEENKYYEWLGRNEKEFRCTVYHSLARHDPLPKSSLWTDQRTSWKGSVIISIVAVCLKYIWYK